jgi:hypothetical protein
VKALNPTPPRVNDEKGGQLKIEEAYEIIEEYERFEGASCCCSTCGVPPCAYCESCSPSEEEYNEALKLTEQFEKENEPMNQIIIDMYPKTKDAVLVQKWFGEKISNEPLIGMLLKGKEAELLAEAQRLENEEKAVAHQMTP